MPSRRMRPAPTASSTGYCRGSHGWPWIAAASHPVATAVGHASVAAASRVVGVVMVVAGSQIP